MPALKIPCFADIPKMQNIRLECISTPFFSQRQTREKHPQIYLYLLPDSPAASNMQHSMEQQSTRNSTPNAATLHTAAEPLPTNTPTIWQHIRRFASSHRWLFVILAAALALRWFGLAWDAGYNHTPHPDERAILSHIVELQPTANIRLLLDADNSPWNPRWFNYGSFPLYAMKVVHLLGGGGLGGEPNDIRIAARALSGLADIATIAAIYGIAVVVFDRRTGLIAAALAAFAVIHIQLSHYFAVDTVQTMLAAAALYFMVLVARDGRLRDSLLAGGLVGLGLATKASQLPIIAPFIVAHLIFLFGLAGSSPSIGFSRRARAALIGALLGSLTSAAVLFLTQPYAPLDWDVFYRHINEQSEMVRGIRDLPYTRQYADTLPYLYHIRQISVWGFGLPLGIAAWGGLIYVLLRGMPLPLGVAYLLVGWALPIGVLMLSTSFIALAAASGIALIALIITIPLRAKHTRLDALLLCWVVPYFLITGSFQVKFMRYLLPIAPLLMLFGARMLIALWDGSAQYRRSLRPLAAALIALVLFATAFYALAYINGVYSKTHTAVRAAEWLNANAPPGSTLVKEHWEESLPNMSQFHQTELRLYENDGYDKTVHITEMLEDADYLYLWSNRLYGTIPRLPERYPITSEYYRLLFSGELGYQLVHVEARYPQLLGVGFMDDTFARPGLPTPTAPPGYAEAPLGLNFGYADESFTVYDHPKVLIFENVEGLHKGDLQFIIESSAPLATGYAADFGRLNEDEIGLVYSPKDLATQRNGDSWTDIVRADGVASRIPALGWLVAVQLMALAALPLTLVACRSLPERGWLFAKPLGVLLVGLVVWLLASLQWMHFSRESIGVGIGVVALMSLIAFARSHSDILSFVRRRWRILLTAEALFLAAYFAFVLVRMANPDLWHPYRGGEKPMDFAYLNAVLRSAIMPPYDPWFGGGYLNYYYWGQFLTAMLIRATGIDPNIAFNLAVPTYFAMTFTGAFAVVYALTETARRSFLNRSAGFSDKQAVSLSPDTSLAENSLARETDESLSRDSASSNVPSQSIRAKWRAWTPLLAGIAGGMFVVVLGNLDGAIQVWHGARRVLDGLPYGEFDFWRSSRMMPPDPPGHEITEFPFFTFLFADLHAHLMALPFTVLVIGLALAVVLASIRRTPARHESTKSDSRTVVSALITMRRAVFSGEALRLVLLGIVIGSLRLLNTWDWPTYMIVGVASILLAEYLAHGGLGIAVFIRAAAKSAVIVIVGTIAFLPYHIAFEAFYNSVESTTNTTGIWQFLAISGLAVFIISSFAVDDLLEGGRRFVRAILNRITALVDLLGNNIAPSDASNIGILRVAFGIAGALLVGLALTGWSVGVVGSTVPFVATLFVLVLAAGAGALFGDRADAAALGFVVMLVLVSLALIIGLDFLRVEGDIDRLNSIFKFYLQVWGMLAIAAAYLLWRLLNVQRSRLFQMTLVRRVWIIALGLLIIASAIYPVLGTRDRLADRYDDNVTPLTLDGTAYIGDAFFREEDSTRLDLAADYEGIEWLRQNVSGSPVVLEGVTPSYRWGGRVSVYTGLPSVVGWGWHQEQQRHGYRHAVTDRRSDVERIYNTQDTALALDLMRHYDVRYIYLGELERYYFPDGVAKFETALSPSLDKVFDNGKTAIYRLRDDA